ncbi:MAG: hypothetical protein MJZ28_07900 [Paludibacteraceae bacterium]|nr:hypothetical protein [Paludibacteraceae bacterium]
MAEKEWDKFSEGIDKLFPDSNPNVVEEEISDTLTKDMLFDFIRQNAATGANGMAVIYKKGTSDTDIFYLASVKDQELVDEKENTFVILKVSDGVKKDVKEMFSTATATEFGKLIIIR